MNVNQLTPNPTNKLTAAVVATAGWAVVKALAEQFLPTFGGDYLWDSLLPVFVYLVGYYVKDEANVAPLTVVNQTIEPAK